MCRICWFSVILVSVFGFAAGSSSSSDEQILNTGFRLKIDADWVYVNASVRDAHNRANALGLGKDDFLLYEDQVPQQVGSCTPAETPFNLLLLMDVSASTSPFIRILRDSALSFARQLRPADRVAVMTFSSDHRLILPLTGDRARLKSVLRLVTPRDGTALYDAAMAALRTMATVNGRKAIVLFSDGVDNQLLNPKDGSKTQFSDLLNTARESDCLIYSIFLSPVGEPESRAAVMKAEEQMRVLATETGARMYTLGKVQDLSANYAEIAQDLRFIYTLAYAPSPGAPAGWRTLKVEVKGHPELSVRARTGYFKRQQSEARSQKSE